MQGSTHGLSIAEREREGQYPPVGRRCAAVATDRPGGAVDIGRPAQNPTDPVDN